MDSLKFFMIMMSFQLKHFKHGKRIMRTSQVMVSDDENNLTFQSIETYWPSFIIGVVLRGANQFFTKLGEEIDDVSDEGSDEMS
jgi:hypothetical protein